METFNVLSISNFSTMDTHQNVQGTAEVEGDLVRFRNEEYKLLIGKGNDGGLNGICKCLFVEGDDGTEWKLYTNTPALAGITPDMIQQTVAEEVAEREHDRWSNEVWSRKLAKERADFQATGLTEKFEMLPGFLYGFMGCPKDFWEKKTLRGCMCMPDVRDNWMLRLVWLTPKELARVERAVTGGIGMESDEHSRYTSEMMEEEGLFTEEQFWNKKIIKLFSCDLKEYEFGKYVLESFSNPEEYPPNAKRIERIRITISAARYSLRMRR